LCNPPSVTHTGRRSGPERSVKGDELFQRARVKSAAGGFYCLKMSNNDMGKEGRLSGGRQEGDLKEHFQKAARRETIWEKSAKI